MSVPKTPSELAGDDSGAAKLNEIQRVIPVLRGVLQMKSRDSAFRDPNASSPLNALASLKFLKEFLGIRPAPWTAKVITDDRR